MIERLKMRLEAERKTRSGLLETGTCIDFTQYKVVCAEIQLLDNVLGLMKDLYVEDEIDA